MGRKSKTGSNPKWIPSAVDWKISEKMKDLQQHTVVVSQQTVAVSELLFS